jgi:hypothetical protein
VIRVGDEDESLVLQIIYDPSAMSESPSSAENIEYAEEEKQCADLNAFTRKVMLELGGNPNEIVELRRNLQDVKLIGHDELQQ